MIKVQQYWTLSQTMLQAIYGVANNLLTALYTNASL